jgi:sporulation integral membrane protein YlbJ
MQLPTHFKGSQKNKEGSLIRPGNNIQRIQSLQSKDTNRKILSKAGIVLFLAIILIFPASSYEGAKRGLLLWFNTVLPTLLPFIILSNLIIRLQITKPLSKLLYPFFHALFHVSRGGCYPVLMGFLSGIPVGAKSIADLVENESIGKEEGQYLLSFCNNASPMFIMSYIAITQLKQPGMRIHLLLIIYISAILSAFIYFRLLQPKTQSGNHELSAMEFNQHPNSRAFIENKIDIPRFDIALLDKAIMDGFEVITKVGGYIILFSIPAEIISHMSTSYNFIKLILIGLLEITTGINQISHSSLDINSKITLITSLTAFGGLSGLAQTKSVIGNSRLSISTYFKSKLLNIVITFIIVTFYLRFV